MVFLLALAASCATEADRLREVRRAGAEAWIAVAEAYTSWYRAEADRATTAADLERLTAIEQEWRPLADAAHAALAAFDAGTDASAALVQAVEQARAFLAHYGVLVPP